MLAGYTRTSSNCRLGVCSLSGSAYPNRKMCCGWKVQGLHSGARIVISPRNLHHGGNLVYLFAWVLPWGHPFHLYSFSSLLGPNIISLTVPKTFLIHKCTSFLLHSKNIPSVFSDLIFPIKASFRVSKYSRSSAPWIRLLYHSANAFDLFVC